MKRRDFLKKGALAAAGAGLLGSGTTLAKGLELTDDHKSVNFNVNGKARMHLTFEPYELKLKHVFTVSSFSRSTTPDVQVRIDYDGYTGYGEASMPLPRKLPWTLPCTILWARLSVLRGTGCWG